MSERNRNPILSDFEFEYITTVCNELDDVTANPAALFTYYVGGIMSGVIGYTDGALILQKAGIKTIGDLIMCSPEQLLAVRGIGKRKVEQLEEGLRLLGLSLNTPAPPTAPLSSRPPQAQKLH